MYLPDGGKINFTVNLDTPLTDVQAQAAVAAYHVLKAAGLTPREPGLGGGEQSETVHYVVRRAKKNEDGTQTPVVDLYVDKLKFRFMGVYLNTPEDVAAFEAAAGVNLRDLPLFRSQSPLKRGEDDELDALHLRSLPHPVTVVFKLNPNATEENKEAKRRFVRWASQGVSTVDVEKARAQLGNGNERHAVRPLDEWTDWATVFAHVEVWIEGKDIPARKAHFWNLVKLLERERGITQDMNREAIEEAIIANRKSKAAAEL